MKVKFATVLMILSLFPASAFAEMFLHYDFFALPQVPTGYIEKGLKPYKSEPEDTDLVISAEISSKINRTTGLC